MANEEKKSEWKPVYCRGLDLVTFLIENNSCRINSTNYDFVELHGDYLRELLNLLEVSSDEDDFELVLSGLRLLRHAIKSHSFCFVNCSTNNYGISASVYQCLETVVNLLLHPNTLVSQFYGQAPRRLLPFDPQPIDQKVVQKVQKAQVKLVEIYCECIGVLGQNFAIELCDIITADRLGVPPWALQPPIDYSMPVKDFSTILDAINLFTKVLTKNVRVATPVIGTSDDLNVTLSKLSEVDHSDIRFALEISAHFLISQILLVFVDDRHTSRQKQLFSRDLSTEVNILLEYARRVSVDPSLHMLSISVKENGKTDRVAELPDCDDDDDQAASNLKQRPLNWPMPRTSQLVPADDALDGIHYLDESDFCKDSIPSTSKSKPSSLNTTVNENQPSAVNTAHSSTLPMDFLAFAVEVFKLVFKMSEK